MRVLVIDDEEEHSYDVEHLPRRGRVSGQRARRHTPKPRPSPPWSAETAFEELAFLDLRLEKANGLDLLPRLLAVRPELAIVIVTAYATVDTASKPSSAGRSTICPSRSRLRTQIRHVVDQLTTRLKSAQRVASLEARLSEEVPEFDLETQSSAMRAVLDTLKRAAPADAPVLLRGENGTGKGVLAQALHLQSPRAARPFVTVNCPTLSRRAARQRSCSATRREPSPAPCAMPRAASKRQRAARCFSTRSAKSLPRCRPSFCGLFKRNSTSASARTAHATSTCAWSPPPTATWKTT